MIDVARLYLSDSTASLSGTSWYGSTTIFILNFDCDESRKGEFSRLSNDRAIVSSISAYLGNFVGGGVLSQRSQ